MTLKNAQTQSPVNKSILASISVFLTASDSSSRQFVGKIFVLTITSDEEKKNDDYVTHSNKY